MSTKIIPFGKYKGQPVEVLKEDDQYREWLMQQDWLRSRFPELRTIIVNNFGQPNDTPEHNAMVAKFIDDDYCMKFIRYMQSIGAWVSEEEINRRIDVENESAKSLFMKIRAYEKEKGKSVPDETDKEFKPITARDIKRIHKSFELREGSDIGIVYPAKWPLPKSEAAIECKPVLSDDFPSVLRQCRDQGSTVLVVDDYTGKGATIDQVRAIYQNNPIIVLTSDFE